MAVENVVERNARRENACESDKPLQSARTSPVDMPRYCVIAKAEQARDAEDQDRDQENKSEFRFEDASIASCSPLREPVAKKETNDAADKDEDKRKDE